MTLHLYKEFQGPKLALFATIISLVFALMAFAAYFIRPHVVALSPNSFLIA
jgi:hypothetical protein